MDDRAAEMGDVAVVDYHGRYTSEGGEETDVPGGKADDFTIDLEEDRFIPGFIDGIVGMKAGETKEVTATFPEDYQADELAGQVATFTITVKELKTRELPDADDDFVKELTDDEVGSVEELRGNLTSNFQKEIDDKNKQNKETAILNELLNHIDVEIPETLLDRELNFMLNQTATQLQQQGMDIRQIFTQEMIPALKERSRPEAIDRIKRTLALGEVAKLEAIQIDNVVLATRIQETLAELKNEKVDPKRLREVLTEELLKETILGWLEENWTIELVPEGTLTPIEREFDDDYDDEDDDDDDVIEVDAIEA